MKKKEIIAAITALAEDVNPDYTNYLQDKVKDLESRHNRDYGTLCKQSIKIAKLTRMIRKLPELLKRQSEWNHLPISLRVRTERTDIQEELDQKLYREILEVIKQTDEKEGDTKNMGCQI